MLEKIIGLTVLGIILYYFIGKAEKSSQFINSASGAYVSGVKALQGRD